MIEQSVINLFGIFGIFVILVFLVGIYCLLVTFNLVRAIIGIEIMTKAITLLLVLVGYVTGNSAFTQALVITLIVIEVAVIAVAGGIVISIFRIHGTIDTRKLRNLKG